MTDSTGSSTATQPAPEPQPLTREELRRHGLPSDWNERLRAGDGGAEHLGQTYRRHR